MSQLHLDPKGDPTPEVWVVSHRRSGTHLMIEYLRRECGIAPGKSHELRHARRATTAPVVYMVRDPIHAMWSTYRWFVHGQSHNRVVEQQLRGLSFADYLRGDGGPRTGFAGLDRLGGDSLTTARGMFYQPIRFWADHVRSYADTDDAIIVRYEDLVAEPHREVTRVGATLGLTVRDPFQVIGRNELVGHMASIEQRTPTIDYWTAEALELLQDEAGDVLERFGYVLTSSPATRRAVPRHDVRYVSRDDNTGYAVAGRRCMTAMAAAGIDFVWEPQPSERGAPRRPPVASTPEQFLQRYRPAAHTDVAILHTMPNHWLALQEMLRSDTIIGHTVWELDRLPASWYNDIVETDQLWVPTEWNRSTLQAAGVGQPIQVVPHVITDGVCADPPIEIPDDVVLFTTISAWHPRKRPDWTLEAFARAFTKDDPVMLIIKTPTLTDGWAVSSTVERMTWWQVMNVLRRHKNPPHVVLVNEPFTDQEINGLLARTDCYVSLAASEGWGLGVFDAATLGTPVITTGFGGQVSYLGSDHPGLVPYSMVNVGDSENSPHLEPDMLWAAADLDAAAAMMRSTLDQRSAIVAAAPALASKLQHVYSPLAVGRHIASILNGST